MLWRQADWLRQMGNTAVNVIAEDPAFTNLNSPRFTHVSTRIIKMKRGKSLLEQGKTNISEVADMVGYSPKQFARYFKMMYGVTPSEYLKTQRLNI